MSDPNWVNVVFLACQEDGANGSTNFTDQSASAHAITAHGTAAWSTTTAPTGLLSSLHVDGNNANYLSIAVGSDLCLGSGDWTVEVFAYASASEIDRGLVGNRLVANGNDVFQLKWGTAGAADSLSFHTMSTALIDNAGSASPSTWTHFATARAGTTTKGFIAGTEVASTLTGGAYNYSVLNTLNIGRDSYQGAGGCAPFNGYLAGLRITKGVARYTTNFTPPTLPFPGAPSSVIQRRTLGPRIGSRSS